MVIDPIYVQVLEEGRKEGKRMVLNSSILEYLSEYAFIYYTKFGDLDF